MSAFLTQACVHFLDRLAAKVRPEQDKHPEHLRTGRRGEEDAYFHLRRLGYIMVARNYRSHRRRGEIDLIGWEKDVLCFIEVKTRSTRDVKPAESAVDYAKQRELNGVAREYLRRVSPSCQWRFDVLSVYYDEPSSQPRFELFRNAFPVS